MADRIFNLPQTRGSFEMAGKVTGTQRSNCLVTRFISSAVPIRIRALRRTRRKSLGRIA